MRASASVSRVRSVTASLALHQVEMSSSFRRGLFEIDRAVSRKDLYELRQGL